MTLEVIKSQTTWNDAASSINSNFAKLLQAILSSEGSGGGGTGGIDEQQLAEYLIQNGYTTEAWVKLQKYLKESDADAKYASLLSFNALKSSFDALNSALNDDVSGKINTWNEIVDFLNEYSGSQDLATILSGMNSDIASRLKTSDFETWKANSFNPLVDRVTTAERNITKNTNAINSINSHMQGVDDTITAIQKQTDGINQRVVTLETWRTATNKTITSLSSQVSTNTTNIDTNRQNIERIFSWFSEDADGNVFTTRNFYSTLEVSGNGLTNGTGGGGGSYPRLDSWANYDPAAGAVLSAILGNDLRMRIESQGSRISALEGASTSVSVSNLSSVGTRIATITIDGVAHEVKGDFLPTSGGTITGDLTLNQYLRINAWSGYGSGSANVWYNGSTKRLLWENATDMALGAHLVVHSGNVGEYAFVPYGSTGANINTIRTNGSYYVAANATNAPAPYGQLICSRNEDTFAQIYIHYTSLAMRFRGGNDASGYYPWHTVLDDMNYSQYALPVIGGTIGKGNSNSFPLTISSTSSYTGFTIVTSGGTAYFRYQGGSTWGVTDAGWKNSYTLIHSGNIGEYAIRAIGTGSVDSARNAAGYDNSGQGSVNLPAVGGFLSVGHSNGKYGFQILGDPYSTGLYYRGLYGGELRTWKTIAFTDSDITGTANNAKQLGGYDASVYPTFEKAATCIGFNLRTNYQALGQGDGHIEFYDNDWYNSVWGKVTAVNGFVGNLSGNATSATKLQTARTIWGQSFDGTGNVDGKIYQNNKWILGVHSDGNLYMGHDTYGSNDTLLFGRNLYMFTSTGQALLINSSGNVTIGGRDLAGTSARLWVDGDSITKGMLFVSSTDGKIYGETRMMGSYLRIFAVHEGVSSLPVVINPSGGNVGIGTTTPQYKLDVAGDIATNKYLRVLAWEGYGSGSCDMWYNGATTRLMMGSGLDIKYFLDVHGATTLSSTLSVGGESTFGDHVTLTSGKRLKLAASNGIFLNNYGIHYQGASANAVNSIFSFSDSGYTTTIHSFFVNPASGVDVQLGNSEYPFYSLATKQIKAHTFYKVSEATNASGQTHQSKAGWYRVFVSRPYNHSCTPIRLFIARNYVSLHNESYVFDITVSYNGKINITQVSGINNADSASLIDQIRVDWVNDDRFYIDFHKKVENNYSNQYMVWGIGDGEFQTPTRVSDTPVGTAYKFNTRRGFKQQGEAFFTTANPYSGDASVPAVVTIDGVHEYATALNVFGKIKLKNLVEFYYHSGNKAVRISHSFYSDGEISANGLSTSSDIRYKNRMNDVSLSLDTIANAPIFRYTWKHIEDGRVHLGTSAQYWLDTEAKELVSINNEDFHRLDYATLGVMMGVTLAKKAKSHEERIKELEMKVESLEAENRRLRYGN